ncbi:MAG: phosphatidylglycerol lysyltransferase domain-containing protein [Dysgonamonadaceae bacterium]|jgi:hypothetical protein|nr:phosphatidylglycerol lysyltransferase domain-containing protein [Dysgonamonadaceae bacterium]
MEFKTIQLSDKPIFDRLLEGNTFRASECCFSNLYGWAHKFNTQYAVFEDFLLIKFSAVPGQCSYLMPLGKGDLKTAIEALFSDCGCKHRFEMSGVTERMWQTIEMAMPGVFEKVPTPDSFDYIYTSEKLIHLTGKKLQSKRNHINRFKKENNWQYVSLNEHHEVLTECRRMLTEWYHLNIATHDESLRLDYITTMDFLHNFDELGLCGGAICVDGKVDAFSLGTRLTDDTFIVHVEKAFADIHGAYTIMNQQFVEHETVGYTYINREEDMGFESLQKAKMSYHPDILLEKNLVKYKLD